MSFVLIGSAVLSDFIEALVEFLARYFVAM